MKKLAAARAEHNAAENALAGYREQLDRVRQAVADRLREAGLTEETFESLKPAIESIEADRDAVEEHRRQLKNAEEEQLEARAAIEGKERPDLPSFEDGLQKANEAFAAATDRRADDRSSAEAAPSPS